eukprot:CAMPEP_0183309456 /NCGR_PEP_ID=MMETSP0160_2-20130417/25353_1 /TAXON_ID=2839 ORGANISM="Odontella Sinensis, Strain Grunow 1884" /NCGR_SAMPLE_ID=MMETSP0160_2 /ASSEMBLY_ACC=CAM_ASM_000250 /LENGTH=255 /DNA_ID=CAMNT_0025473485 /DNA_START=171 /DNA_END=938 /DNA_ORIENTATION=+
MENMADELLCPITTELPVDPVTAEDGRTYERSEMEKLILYQGKNLRSPVTNQLMGPRLSPAYQVRNIIEMLMKSGMISGDRMGKWRQGMSDTADVKAMTKKAENGDTDAMYNLSYWYDFGKKGLAIDFNKAYKWCKKAASNNNVRGMAAAGWHLIKGRGVALGLAEGMALMGMAAQGGSDFAAYFLGVCFNDGLCGLPKSAEWAKFWLQKVVGGNCNIRHLSQMGHEKARKSLIQMEVEDFDDSDWKEDEIIVDL